MEICLIGAGVVGGLLARELSFYENVHVTILEKENDVSMGQSRANSAIVHAGFDAKPGTLKAKLNVLGASIMESVTKELGVHYKKNGSLVVAFSDEETKTLEELLERGIKNGVPDLYLETNPQKIHKIEPALSNEIKAVLVANSAGIVCPYNLAIAAVGNAMDNGADLKTNFKVTSIERKDAKYIVSNGQESLLCDMVINCAGVYSDQVSRYVHDIPYNVHPRRGEYVVLDKKCGTLVNHTIFQTPTKMGKGILVTPTVDGNLLCGPTAEDMEDKEDTSTTRNGINMVMTLAKKSVPTVDFRNIITSFTGLRAVGSTGDFIIEEKDKMVDLIGIESPGLTASPAIALYVTNMLKSKGYIGKQRQDVVRFREPTDKFRTLNKEQQSEWIQKDPRYGKMVCRCEMVTEGEIVKVLHTNPKPTDIDGIKRRTRSGMGRCQGGFCSPSVMELISTEADIPFKDVTKFGRGSYTTISHTKGGNVE